MAEVIWAVRAYEHLVEIAEYIERDSPFQARRVVKLIVKETRRLEQNSRIGHMMPEIREDSYRELRVFNYRILYRIENEDQIAIVGIVHARRLLKPDILG